jgi:hypothetical protein
MMMELRTWKSRGKESRRLGFDEGEERMVSIFFLERERKKMKNKMLSCGGGWFSYSTTKEAYFFVVLSHICGSSLLDLKQQLNSVNSYISFLK